MCVGVIFIGEWRGTDVADFNALNFVNISVSGRMNHIYVIT